MKALQIGLNPLGGAGQVGIESAALAGLADHAYFAALRFDQALGEGQSQAGALDFLRKAAAQLMEILKQTADIVGRDAHAGVFYFQAKSGPLLKVGVHRDAAAGGGEFESV